MLPPTRPPTSSPRMPAAPVPVLPTTSSLHSQPTVSARDQPTARPPAVITIHQPARDTQRRRMSHSPSPPTTPAAAPVTSPASARAAATSAVRPADHGATSEHLGSPGPGHGPAGDPAQRREQGPQRTPSHCRQVRACARVLRRAPAVVSALTCSAPQLLPTRHGTTTVLSQGDEGNHQGCPYSSHPALPWHHQSCRGVPCERPGFPLARA